MRVLRSVLYTVSPLARLFVAYTKYCPETRHLGILLSLFYSGAVMVDSDRC